ncbi:MAG: Na+/H+ antiporter subunit D, partial [Chlorobium sp.]|nr:Na+/H+ antiporter subunit D [Chlorobium sp.]
DSEHYMLVGIALFVSMLTLYSMIKIWNEAFWKDDPRGEGSVEDEGYLLIPSMKKVAMVVPIVILGSVTVVFGFWFEPFFVIVQSAAVELLDQGSYIQAVLGERP